MSDSLHSSFWLASTWAFAALGPGLVACATTGRAQEPLRYLALGDSYTIGEAVDESQRWPEQLRQALRDKGLHLAPPRIIAQSGWTTGELQEALAAAKPEPPFDLVTLLIGVNNQYRGLSLDAYGEEFEQLLQQAIHFAAGHAERVVVVSIPDYGLTPFVKEKGKDPNKIASELDEFNLRAAQLTRRYRSRWVDVTPTSRRYGSQAAMLAEDQLHPSGKMYALWSQLIVPHAQAALQR